MRGKRRMALWRPVCVLLALALCAAPLCGCQKAQVPPALGYAETVAMMNYSVEGGLEEALSGITARTAYDGRIWAGGYQPGGFASMDEAQLWLASALPDGTDVHAMQLGAEFSPQLRAKMDEVLAQQPQAASYTYQAVHGLFFDEQGGLHIELDELARVYVDGQPDLLREETFTLCTLSAQGTLERGAQLQLPEELKDVPYSGDCLLGGAQGSVWLCCPYASGGVGAPQDSGAILRFSLADGACTSETFLPQGYYIAGQRWLADGRLLVLARSAAQEGAWLFTLSDVQAKEPVLSPAVALAAPAAVGMVRTADDAGADVFVYSPQALLRCDVDTGAAEELLRFEEYGVNGGMLVQVFQAADDQYTDRFLAVRVDGGMNLLTFLDMDALAGRQVLTLGAMEPLSETLRRQVHSYNLGEPQIYIRTADYSDAAAQDAGYADGMAMLQSDLLAGKAPDILLLSNGADNNALIRQGLFADMYPLLDADEELSRGDFVPGVLAACSWGQGALPTLVPAYTVLTAAGSAAALGPDMGWTWQEYDAFCAAHPGAVPFYGYGRENVLLYLLQMGGSRFVDYAAGQAHLDDAAFVQLLEESAAFPAQAPAFNDDPKPALTGGQALLRIRFVNDWRSLLTLEYEFDGPVTFKGFPSDEGSVGSAVIPALRVGITRYCADIAAAWSFVRTLLLPPFQESLVGAFPLRQDTLAAAAAAAQQPGQPPAVPPYLDVQALADAGQLAYWEQGLSEDQAQQMLALIAGADTLYQYDSVLTDIVFEEAQAFYAGQHTAAEAAALMQARVQTYLDENG